MHSGEVYPFGVFSPHDPWVTATVRMEREYKSPQGIMTWGPNAWAGKVAAMQGESFDPLYLHDYDTFQVDETLLARRPASSDRRGPLFDHSFHTSATNGGFETSIRPWDNRDPGRITSLLTVGFAARYNEVGSEHASLREVGDDLHLASALAAQWVMPGKTVSVKHGATSFGKIDYRDRLPFGRSDGGDLLKVATGSSSLTLPRIPWFIRLTSASADGRTISFVTDGQISVPPSTQRAQALRWVWVERPHLRL